jgi:gliding motility-associated-like protein
VDQIYVLAGSSTFSVVTDAVAGGYQWEESTDNGTTWVALTDGGDYAGSTTADLVVSTPDLSKVFYRYRVIVSNLAFACDVTTTSAEATFVTPGDFDRDGVFDVVDVDDDNDGILDTVEDNGIADRDTDGDGNPDRIDLDADGDGCFDVTEAGFTDDNGDGFLGDFPVAVDANGQVTSGSDGYTSPNDLDASGTPDFQEAGAAAAITTQPSDQDLVIGTNTFSVVATADTYQWEESQDGGSTWNPLADGGDYAGTTTADLSITNSDIARASYRYRVVVSNIGYACDPTTFSVAVGFTSLSDFDGDGVVDVVDVDDDNDGILDTVEDNGVVDRDTDGNGTPDRTQLDADGDGCFDVTEAGFTDVNGDGELGDAPVTVDASGQVTSGTDGYTPPNDLDGNGTPDFQEAGAAAAITTQPVDQEFLPGDSATFSVVASADTYQWEESQDGGTTWTALVDGGNYAGATSADLTVSNLDLSVLSYQYRVLVSNLAYACDPVTTSEVVGFVLLEDTDNDGVPDLVDVDDDNDGILDTVEDNGVTDRDTDGDGTPDRIQLDADSDGCFDVTEGGFTDNGMGMLGTSVPPVVDADGRVTSATDGYTTPNDLDNNGTPDFQEAGTGATITTQPVDQDFVLNGSATFTVDSDGAGYQWQVSTDGVNWTDLADDATYSGTTTTTLTVSNLLIPNYFEFYRAVATNVAYACDPGDISLAATYNELADTDNDGVFDIVDIDDDNDGIYDSVEGEFTDSNQDGTPDRISLDSDSDGCADVREAGFDDPDGDGILGTSPVSVDADGQVVGQGGYTTPNDLNNNGVFDFQEAGSPSVINNQPLDATISLGQDAVFEVSGNATYYRWQESTDGGSNWTNLSNSELYSGVDTDRLIISGARGRLEGNRYRVVLTSPDFACDPNPELVSDAVRLIFDTGIIPSGFSPNGDGNNDVFSIPGLIETPQFTMEVFDRWGNSVYKYQNNGSLNPDWWDGRSTGNMTLSKGELVPAGTYFYMIEFNDGNTSPAKGWVYINY